MDQDVDIQNMVTYKLVEQALINLGYIVDFDLRYHAKLSGYKPVEGYKSDIVIEFRESYKSELGDQDESLEMEWLMADGESSLFLDNDSLDDADPNPSEFLAEKIILRENFDRVLMEIKQISQTEHD